MRIRYLGYLSMLLVLPFALALPAYSYSDFSRSEIEQLVAPIALYPDPLLAQILPAATFFDQIQDADSYIGSYGRRDIDDQDWDISVRAVSHYPSVLDMMAAKPDWTIALGQAYIDQPDDVMDAIQRLRHRAYDYGYLRSTGYEDVILSGGFIRLDPENPSYIYVPTYDPDIVFVRRHRSHETLSNLISFGLGLAIGAWLDRDTDWDHHRVYYHGWRGGGWVARSRPHITVNNIYVNNSYRNQPIRVNRTVSNRDITPYRNDIRRNSGSLKPPTTFHTRRGRVGSQTGTNQNGGTHQTVTPRTNRTNGGTSGTFTPRANSTGTSVPRYRTNRTTTPRTNPTGTSEPGYRTNRTTTPRTNPTGTSEPGYRTNRTTTPANNPTGTNERSYRTNRTTTPGNNPTGTSEPRYRTNRTVTPGTQSEGSNAGGSTTNRTLNRNDNGTNGSSSGSSRMERSNKSGNSNQRGSEKQSSNSNRKAKSNSNSGGNGKDKNSPDNKRGDNSNDRGDKGIRAMTNAGPSLGLRQLRPARATGRSATLEAIYDRRCGYAATRPLFVVIADCIFVDNHPGMGLLPPGKIFTRGIE